MTVFKTYLKVLNKNKTFIILYTVILICFAAFNMQNNDTSISFTAEKPDILIINQDKNTKFTQNFINYMQEHTNIKDIKNEENAINDALFYRDVNYIIYIQENFAEDFLAGKNPEINVKSTKDYQASLAEMIVKRYMSVAGTYQKLSQDEDTIINNINQTLQKEVTTEITSKRNTTELTKAAFYYNFANYSMLAGCVYVICFIISSFKQETIHKRTVISSTNIKKYNRELLLANSLFAITLWLLYVILSFILIGKIMFTLHGLLLILNAFLFTVTALAFALLIGNIVKNKEAISGIVNVIALGSSFLCGAFVPTEYLPDMVLKIAHTLPSYYYINNNNTISSIETWNLEALTPIIWNTFALIVFIILFVILSNLITKHQRKIG